MSPDGRRLLLQAGVTREVIYTCDTNGGDLTQLTDDEFKNRQPRWMAGGKRIVFYSTRGGPYQLWAIGLDGGDAKMLTAPSLGEPVSSVPTADGERIATYLETTTSNRLAVLRRQGDGRFAPETLPHGAPSDNSYSFPLLWSPKGRLLLVNGIKGLAIFSPESGEVEPISATGTNGTWISEDFLIYGEPTLSSAPTDGSPATAGSALMLYDRTKKNRKVLYRFPAEISLGDEMDLSSDGRSLFVLTNLSRSEIWMMEKTAPNH